MSPTHVAVWLVRLEPACLPRTAALQHFEDLLSQDEVQRATGLLNEEACVAFVYGRALVQLMLRHYLPPLPAFAGRRCPLRIERGGKPALAWPYSDSGLEFNLSHSGSYLACALSWRRQVGIDVEPLARRCDVDLVAACFSPSERQDLAGLDGDARAERLLYYWTLKEAYLKARGGGIADQLDAVSFVARADGGVAVRDDFDKDADDHWGFTVLNVLPGCQVALCWERQSSCFTPGLELKILDGDRLAALAHTRAARPAVAMRA